MADQISAGEATFGTIVVQVQAALGHAAACVLDAAALRALGQDNATVHSLSFALDNLDEARKHVERMLDAVRALASPPLYGQAPVGEATGCYVRTDPDAEPKP